MKIAIASDDGKTIAGHFGRSRGFVICTVEENALAGQEYRLNDFTGHAHGGEHQQGSVHSHQAILHSLADVACVVSRGMGQRIYNDLLGAGIRPYITDQTEVAAAMAAYLAGTLSDFPDRGCQHQH
ncbi:MAG: NifB/NifX family molybdenum-iron cluster-binding protein [Candidatus Neomarinimicrobiota bacterium]